MGCLVFKLAYISEDVPSASDDLHDLLWFDVDRMASAMSAFILGCIATGGAMAAYDLTARVQPILHLAETAHPPVLERTCGIRWDLFLSHIWSTAQAPHPRQWPALTPTPAPPPPPAPSASPSTVQDQCAVIKRQLCLLLPGVRIFLGAAA